jgi:uncharacterized protein
VSTGGPFVFSVTNDRRAPGVQRRVRAVGPVVGLRTSAAVVPADGEVAVDVVLEALTDGRVTATGSVTAPWSGECRRCLEQVSGSVAVDVQEVFEPHPPDDAETYRLDGDRLDLEPMVRDAVLLALPLAPLCREGCAGPDPEDHPVGAGDPDEAGNDPRWAALRQLHFD